MKKSKIVLLSLMVLMTFISIVSVSANTINLSVSYGTGSGYHNGLDVKTSGKGLGSPSYKPVIKVGVSVTHAVTDNVWYGMPQKTVTITAGVNLSSEASGVGKRHNHWLENTGLEVQ